MKLTKIIKLLPAILMLAMYCSVSDIPRDNELDPSAENYANTDSQDVNTDANDLSFSDFTFGTGDSEISVTQNFTVTTSGANGTTISWSSDDISVSFTGGAAIVTRPVFGAGDAVVTLTATIEKNGVTETRTFQITVLETPQTDAEAVAADKAALDFSDFMFGTGDSEISVTQSFSVPTSGSSGTTISWSSDDISVSFISGAAIVTRPVFGAGDAVVTLTATIEKNGVTETKTFQITVLETPQTDAESVSADKAALDFSDFMFGTGDDNTAVTQSFSVPTSGSSGTTISWSSDRDAVSIIAGTATVLQPLTLTGDVTVTLTATIEKNSVFETKVFTITVLETSSTPVVKDQVTYSVGVNYNMRYVPPKTFSTGVDDNGDINGDTIQDVATTATVAAAYLIAETEVTYELWYEVYIWAKTDAGGGVRADGGSLYKFANSGHQGGDASACGGAAVGNNQSPVTCVNWRDAIVWCNALTEYYNAQNGTSYTVVYTVDAAYTTPIRSSEDGLYGSSVNSAPGSFDNPYYNPNAKGFRLPTNNEWELAARYIADINSDGDILDANEYYPGNYASGATADHNNVAPTGEVAWYAVNAGSISHIVATRIPNALGIYDMSGNAWEWTLDWYTFGSDRMLRGGGWNSLATALQVGYVYYSSPSYEYSSMGFRLARTP